MGRSAALAIAWWECIFILTEAIVPQLLCGLSLSNTDCQDSAACGWQITLVVGSVKILERIYKTKIWSN